MAKELLIVFVYDCERCKREEDDPQDAVVYFYPSWVSEQQRHALCGQLMGVSQFLNTVFSAPNILALQTGKFAIKSLGRFILCVGTDRNIPDLVLDTRISTLYRLIRFYHMDFETVTNKSGPLFFEKLNQIFETYLPILQYAGNVFGSIPTFNLPKSASSVFLEAIQILQTFRDKTGVIGGVLLYQNKVMATQLSAKLTKLLVITDPYRIKIPADNVKTQFRLPVGVQLMTVNVEKTEIETLVKESCELNEALKTTHQWRQENLNKGKNGNKQTLNKEVSVAVPQGFGMKRDVSRIFTVVEEAEGEGEGEGEEKKVPDVVRDAVNARKAARMLPIALAGFIVPNPPIDNNLHSKTTDDITSNTENKVNIRYQSLGVTQSQQEGSEDGIQLRPFYNTISDPTFPLFRHNGLPASQALYDGRVTRHYHQLSQETKTREKQQRPRSFAVNLNEDSRGKKERVRRALNLNLNFSSSDLKDIPMTELSSKKPMSIPLTPLMAKLSLLAMEQQGGVCGTPVVEKAPTPMIPTQPLKKIRSRRQKEKQDTEKLEEKVLYVCGYQDMTLLLLLDTETSQDPDQIHSLWQMSVSSLSELEGHLQHCLEGVPGAGTGGCTESYSWLSVAPGWGTVQRAGPWAGARLELLTSLHHQLNIRPHLTEITIRSEDSIVYGSQSGGVQVFYQQSCSEGSVAGLPAPSDLMGVVALKARRRLERDHNVILL